MSGGWDEHVDMDGDPIQSGLYTPDSPGVSFQAGLVLGIVLSVSPADAEGNMLRDILAGGGLEEATKVKASYIEANVLAVYSGHEENMVYQHCVVLPFGKSSKTGPTEDEPADFSEDVPNGCTAQQLEEFYAGGHTPLDELSGDWVILQFIGGMTQNPIVTHWFPNPYNNADPAETADGKRWRLRRNNTDLLIDKNGDFSIAHRSGNFFQLNGKTLTIKHADGAQLFMDDEGRVSLVSPDSLAITMSSAGGIVLNNGSAMVSIKGDDVRIQAGSGEVNIQADSVNMQTAEMNVGVTGGQALANETLATDAAAVIQVVTQLLTVLQTVPLLGTALTALMLQPFDPNDLSKGTLGTVLNAAIATAKLPSVNYQTKALSSS